MNSLPVELLLKIILYTEDLEDYHSLILSNSLIGSISISYNYLIRRKFTIKRKIFDKKQWYLGSEVHREDDKPAIKNNCYNYISFHWVKYGKYYREDNKPTYIKYNLDKKRILEEKWVIGGIGYKQWKYHRERGPAIIKYHLNGVVASEEWYYKGKRHRIDGPARIIYDYSGKCIESDEYINGKIKAYVDYWKNKLN